MKTLTLIAATGATLALLAPTAGAKNALDCATTRQAHSAVTTSPYAHQVTRNLLYFGASPRQSQSSRSCQSLQSAKGAGAYDAPSMRFRVDRDSL
jgi:hypothetical protein